MSMATPTGDNGSLERLDIEVSTVAPEDILTPNAVKAARFHKSKPWGYHPEEVQNFVDMTKSSIEWYRDALHTRDKDVHRLGQEIDDRESRIANLNLQLASASYNSNVSEAISRNAEDKEMADLLARQEQLAGDLRTAQQTTADLRQQLTTAQQEIADRDAQLALPQAPAAQATIVADTEPVDATALEDKIAQLSTRNAMLEDRVAELENTEMVNETLQARVEQLEKFNQEMEDFADKQEEYITSLLTQIPQDTDESLFAQDAEGEPGDGDTLQLADENFDAAEEITTEEADEQTYGIEDADELTADDDPAGGAEASTNSADHGDGETYMYNGMPLPAGIRPEDL